MRISSLCKGIAIAAAILVTPLSAHASRCDGVYEQTLNDCRANKAAQCDNARHEARRACHSGSRYDCRNARRISDNVCAPRGCRSQAESARHACFRDRRHHRGYYR